MRPIGTGTKRLLIIAGVVVLGALLFFSIFRGGASTNTPLASKVKKSSRVERMEFTLGTVVRIVVEGADAPAAMDTVVSEMERLTGAFDRFQPNSDISRLNASNGEWVAVSTDTFTLLKTALSLAEQTDGVFDPTIAPLIDLWGFVEVEDAGGDPSSASGSSPTPMVGSEPPDEKDIETAKARVDYSLVELHPDGENVRLLPIPGEAAHTPPSPIFPQIDLGAIAKGFAADRAADVIRTFDVDRALIDMGGDMYALGARNDNGDPWRLGLKNPHGDGILAVVLLHDRAVATSGNYERFFEYEGQRYHHIIDPRTGYPAPELASVTVVAPTSADADALATALFVLGLDDARAFLDDRPHIGAIIVTDDGDVHVTESISQWVEMR